MVKLRSQHSPRTGYARGVDRFRVAICGGGIAAVEALLRLRRRVGDAVQVTLVAPGDELRYRPPAVGEAFSRPGARRYPLWKIVSGADADWVQEELEWVDPDGQVVHTAEGRSVEYDALLVAVGARTEVPYEHVTVFDDAHADETYRGLVQDVEGGYTRSVALLLPEGPAWPLPIYELALMTAQRAESMGMEGIGVHVVTAEPEPRPPSAGGPARPSPSCSSPVASPCISPPPLRCPRRESSGSPPRRASSSPSG